MDLTSKIPDEETIAQLEAPQLTKRILVVEDDPSVQKVLKRLFEAEGFAVPGHMHLPKLSGHRLCQEMKAAAPSIPIIILTASSDLNDKVNLLEMGADDYITKPFSPRELLARLRVALRHSNSQVKSSRVEFDGITVDFEKIEVVRNGAPVALTAHEFKTLQFFILNRDRLITRTELIKAVCGYEDGYTTSRSIDNHIMKLRQALERNPGCPIHFRTIPRLGYRFTLV